MIPILYETFPMVPGMTRQQLDELGFGPSLRLLKDDVVGDLDDVLWVLMGTIVMLLLVACANVANLALVRAETRAHEFALRTALGAEQMTIARSLLVESALLGFVSGVIGLGLAAVSLPQLLSFAAEELPEPLAVVAIDARVLVFALVISAGCGLLFGAIPVMKYAAPRITAFLGATGRGYSASRERHHARNSLVIVQVALALMLLVASGLMIRTFVSLRDVHPGFTAPDRIQTFRLSIPQGMTPEFDRVVRMQNDLEDRLAAIPGVQSVGLSSGELPLLSGGPSGPFLREDRPDAASILIDYRYVSPGFFRALGTPLVAGRELEWRDY
jgi:hypothetical protein